MLSYLCLASAMMIVGAYVGFSKVLVAVFPVFLLAWLRFGIAAVAMATWLKRGVNEPPLDARTKNLLFLESFLGNFLFSICMLFGMKHAAAHRRGVLRGELRGDRQAINRQRFTEAHQRTHQCVGARAGDAIRHLGRAVL